LRGRTRSYCFAMMVLPQPKGIQDEVLSLRSPQDEATLVRFAGPNGVLNQRTNSIAFPAQSIRPTGRCQYGGIDAVRANLRQDNSRGPALFREWSGRPIQSCQHWTRRQRCRIFHGFTGSQLLLAEAQSEPLRSSPRKSRLRKIL
jgi:hypothetical protein